MKPIKTKKEIRQELDQQIEAYLQTGGAIQSVAAGISGREDGANLNQHIPFSEGQKQSRTLVTEQIKAIDERRQKKKADAPAIKNSPKKRIIYDDFGDPIREVWE